MKTFLVQNLKLLRVVFQKKTQTRSKVHLLSGLRHPAAFSWAERSASFEQVEGLVGQVVHSGRRMRGGSHWPSARFLLLLLFRVELDD